jgi:hypothetical protein
MATICVVRRLVARVAAVRMDCDPFPSANGAHHHRWVNLSLNRSVVPKRDLRKPDFHFRSRSSLSESLRRRASERLGREQAPSEHVRVPLTGRSRTHRTCTLFAQRSPKPERGSGRRPQQQPQPRQHAANRVGQYTAASSGGGDVGGELHAQGSRHAGGGRSARQRQPAPHRGR